MHDANGPQAASGLGLGKHFYNVPPANIITLLKVRGPLALSNPQD